MPQLDISKQMKPMPPETNILRRKKNVPLSLLTSMSKVPYVTHWCTMGLNKFWRMIIVSITERNNFEDSY